jgi:hypothetical protein
MIILCHFLLAIHVKYAKIVSCLTTFMTVLKHIISHSLT